MLDFIKVNLWKTIIGAKMTDLNLNFSLLKMTTKNFGNYPSFWLTDLPLLLLPNQIYKSKTTKLIYKILKKGYMKLKGVRA
jgi:hypothetical protein